MIPSSPRLDPRYRPVPIGSEGVLLLADRGYRWLPGELFAPLVAALDGRSPPRLVEALRGRLTPAQVFSALVVLAHRGLLRGAQSEAHAAADRLFEGPRPGVGAARGRAVHAALAWAGEHGSPELDATLRALASEHRLAASSAAAEITLLLTTDLARPLAGGGAALPVEARRETLRIGPWLRPGRPPCRRCLRLAIERGRPFERLARRAGIAAPEPPGRRELERAVGWSLAALAAHAARGSGDGSPLARRLWSVDLVTGEIEAHPLAGRPGCPRCGDAAGASGLELALGSRQPVAHSDGGLRVRPPERTLAELMPFVSPETGVVSSLRRLEIPAGDRLQVWQAAPAPVRSYASWQALERRLRSRATGKGRRGAQARASALAEAIERAAGVFRGDEPRLRASFAQLGEPAVHPDRCTLFSRAQLRQRERWNRIEGRTSWIPEPFDVERPIEWSALWSLTHSRPRLLPTALCYYDYAVDASPPVALADSNGCAAGNTREEAVLQGLCELVERDAAALWWYSRAPRPRLPLADRYAARLERLLAARGRELWLLDLTTDLGVTVVAAVSRERERRAGDLLLGFGAHPGPAIAASRALSELAQHLPSRRDGREREAAWLRLAASDGDGWIEGLDARPAAPAAREPLADIAACLGGLVARLARRDLETLVLDQTRAETPLAVVRVVVPGLRPWWPRFAPGRLYDVPLELGWLDVPLREDELNPAHLFL